jgi:hypothetical protein
MGGVRGQEPAYTDSVMGTWSFGYDQLNRLTTAANSISRKIKNPYPAERGVKCR